MPYAWSSAGTKKLCAQCLQQCFRAHCAHTIANIYYSTAWTCAYDMRGRDTTACTLHMCSCCAVLSVTPLFSWCVVPQMDSSLLESIHAMRNEAYNWSWLWCNVLRTWPNASWHMCSLLFLNINDSKHGFSPAPMCLLAKFVCMRCECVCLAWVASSTHSWLLPLVLWLLAL